MIGILFSKGNIPVAKANAPLLQLKSFPPPVFKLVGEAIKSGGFPQVGKPDEMAKFKFIDKYNKLKTIHWFHVMVSLDHYTPCNVKGLGL
ncbi:hypothetical protein ACMX2M_20940 [Paenibacillus polymyxa]